MIHFVAMILGMMRSINHILKLLENLYMVASDNNGESVGQEVRLNKNRCDREENGGDREKVVKVEHPSHATFNGIFSKCV